VRKNNDGVVGSRLWRPNTVSTWTYVCLHSYFPIGCYGNSLMTAHFSAWLLHLILLQLLLLLHLLSCLWELREKTLFDTIGHLWFFFFQNHYDLRAIFHVAEFLR
jgi:hypothetical protein